MMTADPHATWVIQSWQGNPTTALLQGLGDNRNHALVLDLYAEKTLTGMRPTLVTTVVQKAAENF